MYFPLSFEEHHALLDTICRYRNLSKSFEAELNLTRSKLRALSINPLRAFSDAEIIEEYIGRNRAQRAQRDYKLSCECGICRKCKQRAANRRYRSKKRLTAL